jgi:hypothetical protein
MCVAQPWPYAPVYQPTEPVAIAGESKLLRQGEVTCYCCCCTITATAAETAADGAIGAAVLLLACSSSSFCGRGSSRCRHCFVHCTSWCLCRVKRDQQHTPAAVKQTTSSVLTSTHVLVPFCASPVLSKTNSTIQHTTTAGRGSTRHARAFTVLPVLVYVCSIHTPTE